MMKIKHLYKI